MALTATAGDPPLNQQQFTACSQDFLARMNNAADGDNSQFSLLSLSRVLQMIGVMHPQISGNIGKQLFGTREHAHENISSLMNKVDAFFRSAAATFTNANLVALHEDFPIANEAALRAFAGEIEAKVLAYKDATVPQTTKAINDFVDAKTNHLIPTIISKEKLQQTKAVLLNALYFKDYWLTPFTKEKTRNAIFTNSAGVKQTVKMMKSPTLRHQQPIIRQDNYMMLRVPYKSTGLFLTILVPNNGHTTKDFHGVMKDRHQLFTASPLQDETGSDSSSFCSEEPNYVLQMPKFKLETEDEKIADHLQALGIDVKQFDFDIVQKAVTKVKEESMESAVVTMGFVAKGCCFTPEYPVVTVDRPFLWSLDYVSDETIPVLAGVVNTLSDDTRIDEDPKPTGNTGAGAGAGAGAHTPNTQATTPLSDTRPTVVTRTPPPPHVGPTRARASDIPTATATRSHLPQQPRSPIDPRTPPSSPAKPAKKGFCRSILDGFLSMLKWLLCIK